ncbi:unnamed protein product (macronuclear) [Paramecium tetraurelia]|uniref:Dolichyl-diphosphooligosaccharide--protein glycosyltransferase subunit OST2 n=1 Tax=Paramecium tetraurelia TaxID=5888 RepID=A0EFY2_PARTE|nr:uncharacterized protein GSPATT00026546001 [Paramecium tetraurelia]CAK94223.1 unnamed protein product [Paramecium tetraurelia]|eukprot:XP_001461596.1 hypothetical protein (macronuclear) [Paramecium tetraurelia strain d4-2]
MSETKFVDENSLLGIAASFWQQYSTKTPQKLKIMDAFSLYCFILVIIQLFYCALVGDFPRNSFLSGIFAAAGAMIINICLRKQLNPETKYMEISNERAFWEYLAAMVVLFLTVINFLG